MDYAVADALGSASRNLDVAVPKPVQLLIGRGEAVRDLELALRPFHIKVISTPGSLKLEGDNVAVVIASRVIQDLCGKDYAASLDRAAVGAAIEKEISRALKQDFVLRLKGIARGLQPMTLPQLAFLRSLLVGQTALVIGAGKTGTGKTHLAIAAALSQLVEENFKRVVITRPHVVMEGEIVTASTRAELDYDSQFEYLEDSVVELVGHQGFQSLRSEGKLQLLPLGHVQGRTFNDSMVIIDEAQNMTARKMRAIVTRIGRGSRFVVTGDPSHVDLRTHEPSGLSHLMRLVEGTGLAAVHNFDISRIIRHPVAAQLDDLYEAEQSASSL